MSHPINWKMNVHLAHLLFENSVIALYLHKTLQEDVKLTDSKKY